jgi:hypothetical protein
VTGRFAIAASAALAISVSSASAAPANTVPATPEPTSAAYYAAALFVTTVAYHPFHAPIEGPQGDVTGQLGIGRILTPSVALELDVGATVANGELAAVTLVPGVVWTLHPALYAAARLVVPVSPEMNFGLSPGFGVMHGFENGITPVLELDAISMIGRGQPDLGIALVVGALYNL